MVISVSRDVISVSELGRLQMKEALYVPFYHLVHLRLTAQDGRVKRNLEELGTTTKWKRNSDQRSIQLANEAVEAATDYLHDAQVRFARKSPYNPFGLPSPKHTCKTAQGMTPATLKSFLPSSSPGASSSSTPLPASERGSIRTIRRKSAMRFTAKDFHRTGSSEDDDNDSPPPVPPKSSTQRVKALMATSTPRTATSRLLESNFGMFTLIAMCYC